MAISYCKNRQEGDGCDAFINNVVRFVENYCVKIGVTLIFYPLSHIALPTFAGNESIP